NICTTNPLVRTNEEVPNLLRRIASGSEPHPRYDLVEVVIRCRARPLSTEIVNAGSDSRRREPVSLEPQADLHAFLKAIEAQICVMHFFRAHRQVAQRGVTARRSSLVTDQESRSRIGHLSVRDRR